jgi:hypothetical protein
VIQWETGKRGKQRSLGVLDLAMIGRLQATLIGSRHSQTLVVSKILLWSTGTGRLVIVELTIHGKKDVMWFMREIE